jgi:hypothetical protein
MQGIDCLIKRGNMMPDSLLLTVKVVYGVLTLWRNFFHGCKLNRGQDLIRNRRISALIIQHPAHVEMVATV